MLPAPTIAVVIVSPLCESDSSHASPDVAGKKAEGLVDPDPVDRLPVLGDEPVIDAEEIESREVRRAAAGGDRAVLHASGREPVVLGDNVRLQRPPGGHRPAVDGYRAGKGGPAVRSPARVLDVAVGGGPGRPRCGQVPDGRQSRRRLRRTRPSRRQPAGPHRLERTSAATFLNGVSGPLSGRRPRVSDARRTASACPRLLAPASDSQTVSSRRLAVPRTTGPDRVGHVGPHQARR